MPDVCVVGAGPAGLSAAREASAGGARVTLFESSAQFPLPRSRWPLALRRRSTSDVPGSWGPLLAGLDVRLGETAKAVRAGSLEIQGVRTFRFDGCVLATGSLPSFPVIHGRNKRGVFLLGSERAYAELGRAAGGSSRPVVSGRGIGALFAAECLAELSSPVSVYLHEDSEVASLGPSTRDALLGAAARHGVRVSFGRVEKALGVQGLEAVVANGEVVACDVLAAVPDFHPNVSLAPSARGRLGGYAVDQALSTCVPGVFAAGSSAELDDGTGRPLSLEGSPGSSGRVAGANASNSRLKFRAPRQRRWGLFGLTLLRSGLSIGSASAMGFDAAIECGAEGDSTSCSIVYDRRSGQVLGVDALEPASDSSPGTFSLLPDGRADLATVAYGQWEGATDISVISETARQGLRTWRRC